jgi:hypothetical protein
MPPVDDILRLLAVVLSVIAGASILSVIRLHWKAWISLRRQAPPVWSTIRQNWRTWPTLRREMGFYRSTKAVLIMNRMAIMRVAESPGLTPFHVWAVAVSHGMLLCGISFGLIDQLGQDHAVSWRVGIYIVAPLLTIVALIAIAFSQRRKVSSLTTHTTETETTHFRCSR